MSQKTIFTSIFLIGIVSTMAAYSNTPEYRDSLLHIINATTESEEQLKNQVKSLRRLVLRNHPIDQKVFADMKARALKFGNEAEANWVDINLVTYYYNAHKYKEAIRLVPECLKKAETVNQKRMGFICNDMANLYRDYGQTTVAIELYLKSAQAFRDNDMETKVTYPISNLADLYLNIGDWERAEEYNLKALSYSKKLKKEKERAYNTSYDHFRLANVYANTNRLQKAEEYYEIALADSKKQDHNVLKLESINEYLNFAIRQKKAAKAANLIENGKIIKKELDQINHVETVRFQFYESKYQYYFSKKKPVIPLDELLKQTDNNKLKKEMNVFGIEYYSKMGDIQKALDYSQLLKNGLQGQLNKLNHETYISLEDKYKVERLHQENSALRQLAQKNKNVIIGGFIALAFLSILAFLFNHLYRKTRYLNAQLHENNKKITLQNKELEQLTYITTHDLKEPANTIMSFSNLIKTRFKSKLPTESLPMFSIINGASKNMNQMISRLHEYLIVGNQGELSEVNCNQLVNDVLLNLSHKIEESKADIKVETLPTIDGYELELKNLMQNIIANAIKYRHEDKAPKINIKCSENDDFYVFQISDNGIGIQKEHHGKIFDLFQTLHNKSEQYSGNGIGLANARKIVELHQGLIWVESDLGLGSHFNFTISKRLQPKKTKKLYENHAN